MKAEEAARLEAAFLGGLDQAQTAYERIIAEQAWTLLGHDSFADWWRVRVVPTMHALSMRPIREITASAIEQVKREDAERPPLQRHTQREVAEMFGESDRAEYMRESRSSAPNMFARDDLVEQVHRLLPPDPEAPHRGWRRGFLADVHAAYRPMSRYSSAEEVAERADDQCIAELVRVAEELARFTERVRRFRRASMPDNVISIAR